MGTIGVESPLDQLAGVLGRCLEVVLALRVQRAPRGRERNGGAVSFAVGVGVVVSRDGVEVAVGEGTALDWAGRTVPGARPSSEAVSSTDISK